MRTLLILAAAATLTACATPVAPPPPPPLGEPQQGVFDVAGARATAEADLRAALGPAAFDEIGRAPTAIIVRQGVSLPRMIQQPDGSWKPEGPRLNAAILTPEGWVGWPGGQRTRLAPETGRELDRLLASPALWTEPAFGESGCTDWAGQTTVLRHGVRERVSTQVCGSGGLTGRLANIVLGSRVIDWAGVPAEVLPAGIPLTRFPEPIAGYFRFASALRDPTHMVVRTPGEWEGMWRRITANQGPAVPPPPVHFGREMLLLAAMGAQPTGGYTIRIDRVIEHEFDLEAHVIRTSPGPRCGAIAAITHPVDIVRIPASAKQVRWVLRDEVTDCP